jgi:hypothetical protein
MRYCNVLLIVVSAALSGFAYANSSSLQIGNYSADQRFNSEIGIGMGEVLAFSAHPTLKKYLKSNYGAVDAGIGLASSLVFDPVADYVTVLPHASQLQISPFEKAVLAAYMNHPRDSALAEFLALYHLEKSLLNRYRPQQKGAALKHTIIAQYFLNRSVQLGGNSAWVEKALKNSDTELKRYFKTDGVVASEENHASHQAFYDAFNYHEENRYSAASKLLDDFAQQPNNIFTSFLIMSIYTWIGGEASFDDPTALYDFAVGSYFAVHTINVAHRMEDAWTADPVNHTRFRLAPIIGGIALLDRRWLAKFHGDAAAIALIDQEHREWLQVHPKFHGFTVGVMFFEEDANFMEGFGAWSQMVDPAGCEGLRTCTDQPRFSFNLLGIFLGYVDYLLKIGATDAAQMFLGFRHAPWFRFEDWDLGRAAWEHRENHLLEIADLYANDDPADDPNHFFLTSRKWGANTSNCQTCHQVQSRFWTEEEKNTVIPLPDEILTVSDWPVITTTWYAEVKTP